MDIAQAQAVARQRAMQRTIASGRHVGGLYTGDQQQMTPMQPHAGGMGVWPEYYGFDGSYNNFAGYNFYDAGSQGACSYPASQQQGCASNSGDAEGAKASTGASAGQGQTKGGGGRGGKDPGKGKGKNSSKGKGKSIGKGKGSDASSFGGGCGYNYAEGENLRDVDVAGVSDVRRAILLAQRKAKQRDRSAISQAQRLAAQRFEKDMLERLQGAWIDAADDQTKYNVEGSLCSVTSGDAGRVFRNKLSIVGGDLCWDAKRFWHKLNIDSLPAVGEEAAKVEWLPGDTSAKTNKIVWLRESADTAQ